jgi:sarcosine oxidase
MYDVIVIGVGSMGSSACYHLAKKGAKVLGIEQFTITHENGSHTGESRLIRQAYFEHSDYVPLLRKAYEGWSAIQKESKRQLYWETGLAYFGLPDSEMLEGVLSSANLYDIPIQQFSTDQINSKWPQFNLPKGYTGLLEPEAGLLKPELAIQTLVNLAMKCGAEIHSNEQMLGWEMENNFVKITTNKSNYHAKKIIFTAGAFSEKLLKTKASLKVTQQFIGWTAPLGRNEYSLGNFPCWMISELGKPGPYYGFPEIDKGGLKIAYHREGEVLTTDLDFDVLEKMESKILNEVLRNYLPNVRSEIEVIKRCKYTYSSDQNFIIDQLSGYDNKVILAAGFSGHGFKFVPVIGAALADLALEEGTDLPIEFLGLDRFE